MRYQGGWIQRLLRSGSEHGGTLLGLVITAGLLSLPALVFGADVAPAAPTEYRDIPYVGSRNVIWVVAQLHLLLAGFVLGVPMFAWVCEVVAWRGGEKRYDKLAKEFTKLLTSAYSTTALFGGILLFLLIAFYPKLMNYLTDIFFPSFIVYCIPAIPVEVQRRGLDQEKDAIDNKRREENIGQIVHQLGIKRDQQEL